MDIMYDKSDVVNHTRVISADVNWVSVGPVSHFLFSEPLDQFSLGRQQNRPKLNYSITQLVGNLTVNRVTFIS